MIKYSEGFSYQENPSSNSTKVLRHVQILHVDVMNSGRKYLLDFYIPALNLFVEIKPTTFISEVAKTKLKHVECGGYNVTFLHEKNWDSLLFTINQLVQ